MNEIEQLLQAARVQIDDQTRRGKVFEPQLSKKLERTSTSAVSQGNNEMTLKQVKTELGDCTRCALFETRKNIVFGVGNPKADLVVVGEAPGRDEDQKGEPFIGRAGKLLTDIIEAIGLGRDDIYICNVIKCRPPENRNPLPEEIQQCEPFLKSQIEAIKPKIICTVGKFAAQTLLQTETPISKLRGEFFEYRGVPLMPTYHPAYLLRNPSAKKEVWIDMKKIHAELCRVTGKKLRLKGK